MPIKETETQPTSRQRSKGFKGVSPARPKKKIRLGAPPFASGPGAGSFPNFIYHGGQVINTPQVYCVFLGDWTSTANQTRSTRLSQFITDLMGSDYMNILSQYGCGTGGTVVGSVFISSTDNDLSRQDIEGVFQTAINNSTLPEPTNPSSVYVLFLDDSTGVNGTFGTDQTVSCEATNDNAFGFHFHFNTAAGNELFYAVVPGLTDTCLTNSCPDDGSCSLHLGQTREQRQTQVLSHEFSEMISNPDVEGTEAWSSDAAGDPHENGDICNGNSGTLTVGSNSWNVQKMYSKYDDQQTNGATTCVLGSSFPLPSLLPACTVILDRSTFGRDEIDAFLNAPVSPGPAIFDAALYVAVDGFTANQLSITAGSFTGTPNIQPTFAFSPAAAGLSITCTSLSAPDQSALDIIQRFTWVCRATFTGDGAFPTIPAAVNPVTVTASLSSVSGSADIQLIDEPNPYEEDGAVSWLSTDLRVFQIPAGQSRFGEPMGSTPADATTFIGNVINRLNTNNTAGQTFDDISTDEASALELSQTVDGTAVFNFAVAKVRYRSLVADAHDVRVFFRLFPASTTSTVYDELTTYRRGGQGGVIIPKLGFVGGQTTTIPFFATPRIDTSTKTMDTQTDEPNHQTLTHDGAGAEVVTYFGCWLDINQPSQPWFPIAPPAPVDGPYASGRQTIQDLIRNAHQCLTAEISLDGVTLISNGQTPGSSDKLAQRNLSIVASDNPGSPASHRIPNTFEIKPTSIDTKQGTLPDELLINWGNTPSGSEATIFLPATSASHILRLADSMYSRHRLILVDNQTLTVPAAGVTYLPIPPGFGPNYAGLLTIDLPSTVRKGQAFKVVVQQLTNASGKRIQPPPVIGSPTKAAGKAIARAVNEPPLIHWRKVLGSFQITIPVRSKEVMLAPEERLLAVLRWIQKSIPLTDRWYPVFGKYVGVVGDRVKALGGDPDNIKPSPGDPGKGKGNGGHYGEECVQHVGKVAELVYDRFGDFEGFVLDTREGEERFLSHELAIAHLVKEAWEERILIKVVFEPHAPHHPVSIIFLRF